MPTFSPPVRVALGKAGNVTHAVTSPERAAEILLLEWPAEPGSRHLAARKAVLAALESARDAKAAKAARAAFEAAAEEAGILMPERPRSLAPSTAKAPRWSRHRRKPRQD